MRTSTITNLLEQRSIKSAHAIAHWALDSDENWQPTTWAEYQKMVTALAKGLQAIGLCPGQHVGIMARTAPNWDYLQMAILRSGGVVVGIDPHDLDDNVNHIAKCADLQGIVAEDATILEKLNSQSRGQMRFIVCMHNSHSIQPEAESYTSIETLLKKAAACSNAAEDISKAADPATIIFTSGTTGTPKGIMYTHDQVMTACRSILEAFDDIEEGANLVCWLPLSNLFQRMINYCGVAKGASTYFVSDPLSTVQLLPEINPHLFIGVPRFFEKLHSGIMAEIQNKPVFLRVPIEFALKIGDAYARAIRHHKNPSLIIRGLFWLMDSSFLKRIRDVMGKNLKYMISGSAPMPAWLLESFHAMGLLVLEADGISENIVPIAINRVDSYKFGTTGKPLSGNELRVTEDDELLVKGPGVFSGYYNYAGNEEGLNPEGWLATGDYVKLDNDGFVSVTGRKSDVFKTSTGRKIAPASIEDRISKVPYIDQAVVYGAKKQYLVGTEFI